MVVSSASVLLGVVYISNVALGYMRAIIHVGCRGEVEDDHRAGRLARAEWEDLRDARPIGGHHLRGEYWVGRRPLSTGAT